ncbi:hypothetical protein MS3_00008087 [Schistosoma haematobium]|uniref:Uncharacterized protein n=1 Tax=Schistosoma haematobium TaxID=6185 RepID=A0A095A1F4_SCHHA|nr:hypothetical protein MS3_00008087 [Schistosoma haematobium]KAH9583793.1 hypothetical protein MS3_00008087 [Schistosoma haematobium]
MNKNQLEIQLEERQSPSLISERFPFISVITSLHALNNDSELTHNHTHTLVLNERRWLHNDFILNNRHHHVHLDNQIDEIKDNGKNIASHAPSVNKEPSV